MGLGGDSSGNSLARQKRGVDVSPNGSSALTESPGPHAGKKTVWLTRARAEGWGELGPQRRAGGASGPRAAAACLPWCLLVKQRCGCGFSPRVTGVVLLHSQAQEGGLLGARVATMSKRLARLGQRAGRCVWSGWGLRGEGVSPNASRRESEPEEGNPETCKWGWC